MGVKLRERKLGSGRISLYLDIYHKGKRKYEFLDLYLDKSKKSNREIKRLAEAIRSKREVQIFNENFDFDRNDPDLLFSDFMEIIAKDFEKHGNKNVWSVLKQIRDYDKHNIPFDDISAGWLKGFKAHLLEEVSKNTARTYFLILRSTLNKAASRGIIKGNPIYLNDIKNIEKDPPRINYLNDIEIEKLWKTDCERVDVKRSFLFSVYTGLRFSDVKNIKWDDIQELIDPETDKTYYQVEMKQGKTNERVHIPLHKDAEKLLDVEISMGDNVFDITESIVTYWLSKWRKEAGIKKHVHFHMARHTFATRLLRRGVDIFTVSKLMGHESVGSTEKYLHLVSSDRKSAIDKM
ncbi:MAG: site-specific integrase [Balneolaceae bacterium]